jgi:hypothetical protein
VFKTVRKVSQLSTHADLVVVGSGVTRTLVMGGLLDSEVLKEKMLYYV